MAVLKHKPHCPALLEEEALCICEGPRYFYDFLIGVLIFAIEYPIGRYFGSEAIKGDAWHMAGDTVHSLLAILVITLIRLYPNHEHSLRRSGGYAQSGLLLLAAVFTLWELFHAVPGGDGLVLLLTGTLASLGSHARFRVLHPEGKPITLIGEIARALWRGEREVTTFIGEILHVLTDYGTNVIVMIGGALLLAGASLPVDEYAAFVIVALLVLGAVAVLVFALRHRHHH